MTDMTKFAAKVPSTPATMSPKKGDIVAETGDIVAETGNIVLCDNVAVFGDIVAGVDGA